MENSENPMKKSFNLTQLAFANLYVTHDKITSLTVLWNKHQIFIYDSINLKECNRILYPEFTIFKVLVSGNHLVCLDFSGNIHVIPLKLKQSAPKVSKSDVQACETNVLSIESTADYIYSLKLVANTYLICQHKIYPDFTTVAKVKLKTNIYESNLKKCLFYIYTLKESEFHKVKNYFKEDVTWNQQMLILLSFDKLAVYAILYSNSLPKESTEPAKLYTCPTNICDINILISDHLSVIISLTIGSVIKVPLETSQKDIVVHLNSAIYKLIVEKNNVLYTDCVNLWKAEDAFTNDVTFKKFFLKNVKDFCLNGDHIICTTFNNIIYLFLNDESCCIETVTQEYFPVEVVRNNSDFIKRIVEKTEESARIVDKINKTKNYITTLALAARQDVMDDILNYKITVYEKFDDILKENLIISLIDDVKNYYDIHLKYILIKISTTSLQQKFCEVLSNVFGDLRFHIIVKSRTCIVKTVTVTVEGHLKKTNIVIPIHGTSIEDSHKINVNIEVITKIADIFDKRQSLWVILHKKNVILNSEQFINIYKSSENVIPLNNKKVRIQNLLYENAVHLYGHLLKFNKPHSKSSYVWNVYIKLPENYEQRFKNNAYLKDNLNPQKAEFIFKQITKDDFLKARHSKSFHSMDEVKLEIVKDGFSKPSLQISSCSFELAFNIKLFFANLIYCYEEFKPGTEFVDQAIYSSIEVLEQAIKKVLLSPSNDQELQNLTEQYQKLLSNLLV